MGGPKISKFSKVAKINSGIIHCQFLEKSRQRIQTRNLNTRGGHEREVANHGLSLVSLGNVRKSTRIF